MEVREYHNVHGLAKTLGLWICLEAINRDTRPRKPQGDRFIDFVTLREERRSVLFRVCIEVEYSQKRFDDW